MDPNNRPTGRKRNVTGKADPIHKKEQGLGTGPVGPGKPGNFVPKPEPIRETRPPVRRTAVRRGGGVSILGILVLLFIFGRGCFPAAGPRATRRRRRRPIPRPLRRPRRSRRAPRPPRARGRRARPRLPTTTASTLRALLPPPRSRIPRTPTLLPSTPRSLRRPAISALPFSAAGRTRSPS